MQKVVTYIQTTGSEIFRNFISLPFSVNLLCNITNEEGINVIFDGWLGKDISTWIRFKNEENVVLEFYPDNYKINVKSKTHILPLPKTINDFINDMDRLEVSLYWNQWMEDNFEPKDYLHIDDISKYFTKLLIRMGKSNELN
jgi:hypothetical protein